MVPLSLSKGAGLDTLNHQPGNESHVKTKSCSPLALGLCLAHPLPILLVSSLMP